MNYLSDYHIHSTFSFDAKQSVEEAARAAIKNGISEICFTEHVSMDPQNKGYNTFSFDDYSKEINRVSEIFKGQLTIKKGIEAGEYHLFSDDFDAYYKSNNLDFIIGSLHNLNNKGLVTNLRENGDTVTYNNYFSELLKLCEVGNFDILGHLDLVQRYALKDFGIYNFDMYKEYIYEILKTIISKGIGIEINTSGLSSNILLPRKEILKMYKELNGEIITVGSDSHNYDKVGSNINEMYELLKSLGFKYVFTYDKRKPNGILL